MTEESVPKDELERLVLHHTDLPPCCLRVNPLDKNIVYLGTYKLVKDSDRHGSIEIYEIDEQQNRLEKLNDIKVDSAILDIKFHSFHPDLLITTHSKGNVMLWKVGGDKLSNLELIHNYQVFDAESDDILITSVVCHPVYEDKLAVTSTSGELVVLTLDSIHKIKTVVKSTMGSDGTEDEYPPPHDLECWIAEFGSQQGLSNVVFSGGDDRNLIAYDLRQDLNENIFKTSRIHDSGIVSILTAGCNKSDFCVNTNPYSLWTGSYDDTVKSLDLRILPPMEPMNGMPPRVKESLNLGGGVWRLIPNNSQSAQNGNKDKLLACCMYDGARILSHDGCGNGIKVDKYFKGDHSSICYGGDWQDDRLVTCSFYDNVVQVWKNPT